MSFRIENVVFFPEKNDFLIVRGGRFRSGSFREGKPVIQINGFERYYFCPETVKVFSRSGRTAFSALKERLEGVRPYFILYLNGVQRKVFLWEILRDNWKEIDVYFTEKSQKISTNFKQSKHTH